MAKQQAFSRALEYYGARNYAAALTAAREEARATGRSSRDPLYMRLLDEICMHAAATGHVVGFDGRLLQVHPADPAASWQQQQAGAADKRRSSCADSDASVLQMASIQEALDAAEDGDVVQLLPGTHSVSQVTLVVSKRIMITGTPGSASRHVVLDHRANHPAFRVDRSCILRGFHLDMVGFCEAISITGASTTVKPILQDLLVSCSGDDGVVVSAKAQPLMRGCELRVRGAGLKQTDSASTTLWSCTIAGGRHALVAADASQTFLEGCTLRDCAQEGVLGLQQARVSLTDSRITGCGGPGADMSDGSSLVMKSVDIHGCMGGVWLWNQSSCEAVCSHITSGSTYAVLLDAEAYARGSSCTIDGPCHVQSAPGEAEDHEDAGSEFSNVSHASSTSVLLSAAPPRGPLPREAVKAAAARAVKNDAGSQHAQLAATAAVPSAAAAAANPVATASLPSSAAAAAVAAARALLRHRPRRNRSPPPGERMVPASPFGHSSNTSSQACLTAMDLCHSEELVLPAMLVDEPAAAAALFPAAHGAFAPPSLGPEGMQL